MPISTRALRPGDEHLRASAPVGIQRSRRALDVTRRAGEVNFEADLRYDFATALLRSGEGTAARAEYERSLAVAPERRQPCAEARATAGLADCSALHR
ncbi:hypothetical protein Aph02nite_27820 [Actinoplanes philippinensis]|uniref:Tetratricopeptide repeat-containing protein n=1 Tax=Actinoplanes philippinensis TaxID=35752 RepID=A0A1I2GDH6_9ACTN|nr:hypothetical protein [Actinoplanes philippinensis]GIE76832.1 hypothetical protein Aph02nite_27820 [Actinoplanes philippinensis]SFF15243.1 hypothetical protein SAMN05421541_106437 [Actinoplanes philippinensis]